MYQPSDFIPKDLKIDSWSDIEPYFDKLNQQPIDSKEDLEKLIVYYSETLSVYLEQNAWAYIQMTCKTDDPELVKRHEVFAVEISPEIEVACNGLQKKISNAKAFGDLDAERYQQLKRSFKRDLEMFRQENVSIESELSKLSSEYGQLAGSMTVTLDGEEMTIPQASARIESEDRDTREKAWRAVQESRFSKKAEHDALMDQMIEKRHQVALNAGYENYRDYQHDNMHRFDYQVKDVVDFHEAIEKYVVPVNRKIAESLRDRLELKDDFRPWDVSGKPKGQKPLKPFKTGQELLEKSIRIFDKIKPQFGDNLRAMQKANLFDLESRKGKAPGGYNYGLEVTGMPFIFMNAAGTHRDLVTLMHEGGHAMHTFLCNDESLFQYRNCPSELAETASMSMELLSNTHWNEFYNSDDLKRARREHLEGVVDVFPWVATVDSFQHWIYTHPKHTSEERDQAFLEILNRFGTGVVNWEGLKEIQQNLWQKQLHIFEVPFYYIEYAIAQLGALQVYRNYRKDPSKAVEDYTHGLSLGNTRPLPQVWDAMNIKFDFSANNLKDLMDFVQDELDQLDKAA